MNSTSFTRLFSILDKIKPYYPNLNFYQFSLTCQSIEHNQLQTFKTNNNTLIELQTGYNWPESICFNATDVFLNFHQPIKIGHVKKLSLCISYQSLKLFACISACSEKSQEQFNHEISILHKIGKNEHITYIISGICSQLENAMYSTGFYIQPFYSEGSLQDVLKRKNFTFIEKFYIGKAIIKGLKVIHDKGISHRNLTLKKVLLDRRNSNEEYKVAITDFKLATKHPFIDVNGNMVGTPAYYSPERVQFHLKPSSKNGKQLNQKDDIWAAGCIFTQLFLNKHTKWMAALNNLSKSFNVKKNLTDGLFWMKTKSAHPKKTSKQCIKNLICEMFNLHPKKRVSSTEALKYMEKL